MKAKYITATICGVLSLSSTQSTYAKSLVAYYSRTGNTRTVAELIRTADGDAEIFEITTADPNHYPAEYRSATQVAQAEIENETYPKISAIPDLSQYDTVYVGTPCWWGTMAGPVRTFLTTADLSNKTVIPFNTHGGSGAGTVHTDITKLTQGSTHKSGIAIYGSDASSATDDINKWLTEIGIKNN